MRKLSYVFVLVLMSNAASAQQTILTTEPGFNRYGADISHLQCPDAGTPNPAGDIGQCVSLCRAACAANHSCTAYTYVNPGIQGATGFCWLKNSTTTPMLQDPNTTSGLKVRLTSGVDGFKYQSADEAASVPTFDPNQCSWWCLDDPGHCRAWTWVKPGIEQPRGVCHLKSAVSGGVHDSCCVAGQAAP
jgi:PAN domain-containing protein